MILRQVRKTEGMIDRENRLPGQAGEILGQDRHAYRAYRHGRRKDRNLKNAGTIPLLYLSRVNSDPGWLKNR